MCFAKVPQRILTTLCDLVSLLEIYGIFLKCFRVSLTRTRDCQAMMEEVLLSLPFKDRGRLLWLASFFSILWGIWLERNILVMIGF